MRTIKPPFFQATWGDVTTTTPYRRPTLEAFAKWWLDFKNIPGLADYNITLVGSFCEKHFGHYDKIPKDLDVVLTNPIKDEEQLKYILSHGIKMGFENRILVDLNWSTGISKFDSWKPFCKVRVGKTFTRILGEQAYVTEYHADEEKRLDSGLWSFCYAEPPASWFKALHRWEEGEYQGITCDVRKFFD